MKKVGENPFIGSYIINDFGNLGANKSLREMEFQFLRYQNKTKPLRKEEKWREIHLYHFIHFYYSCMSAPSISHNKTLRLGLPCGVKPHEMRWCPVT